MHSTTESVSNASRRLPSYARCGQRESSPPRASAPRPYRIDFLTVIPSPYQIELFDAVARHPGLDPRVYYYTRTSPDRQWTPPPLADHSTVLPGVVLHALTRCCCWNPSAARRLRREPADLVVVSGYFTLTSQLVMRNLTRRGVPWVFWGEIPGLHERSFMGCGLRRLAQAPIIRGARAVAAIGSRARAAYRRLLSDDRPVFNIPYCCDLSAYLRIDRSKERAGVAHDLRPLRFLFSGQMIARKGVDLLLRAFVALARRAGRAAPHLTLLGDGPLRRAYEAMVPASLRDHVCFRGHCDPHALPSVFAHADVFVLPSRHDGWGVVINEAAAAGLPVIATDEVGAAHDLVVPGESGLMIPADDAGALQQAMARLAWNRPLVDSFGRRSRAIARDFTVERGAQRWYELCRTLLGPARSRI